MATTNIAEKLLGGRIDPADNPRCVEDIARHTDAAESLLDITANSQTSGHHGQAADLPAQHNAVRRDVAKTLGPFMSTSVSRSTSIAPTAIIQQTHVLCHPDEGVMQASSLVTVASPDYPAASMDTIVSYQARPPAPTLTVRVRCPSRVSATAHPCADGDLRGLAVTARETLAEGASLSRSQPWRQDCSGDCGDVRGPVHPCRVFPVRAPRAATGVPPDSARTFSETDVGFSAWPEGYPQFTSTAFPRSAAEGDTRCPGAGVSDRAR